MLALAGTVSFIGGNATGLMINEQYSGEDHPWLKIP
jgi:hypothetical protein